MSLAFLAAAEEIRAADATAPADDDNLKGSPVNCGIIGLGLQGRELLAQLGRLTATPVVAICDTYDAFLTRSQKNAPKAKSYSDYKQLLAQSDVQAVFVAVPTYLHKQIVLDALQAGKHVYCEAPLAHTIDDARAIAQAGKNSKAKFASGFQYRSNPIHQHAYSFMKAGTLAHTVEGYAQWHKKTSWRVPAPDSDRQKAMNWRLDPSTAAGLMGEIGSHQADIANWFFNALPVSVTGSGSIMHWKDGRDIPDTVNCIFEYPGDIRFNYNATLASSFGESYEMFNGSDASMMMKELRAWMFKETDSPLLGWEVYARNEKIADDLGIVLVANATKIVAAGKEPAQTATDIGKPPLFYAIEDFIASIQGDKTPASDALEGFQATVTGIKANEAALAGSKIAFQKEWFDIS